MLGEPHTGKTSLLIRFLSDAFESEYRNTVGVDLKSQTLKIYETMVRVNVWDTAGQERYRTFTRNYYRQC